MREAVIVEALRTPIGRGKPVIGDLFGFHPAHLLAIAQRHGLKTNARWLSPNKRWQPCCSPFCGPQSGFHARPDRTQAQPSRDD